MPGFGREEWKHNTHNTEILNAAWHVMPVSEHRSVLRRADGSRQFTGAAEPHSATQSSINAHSSGEFLVKHVSGCCA